MKTDEQKSRKVLDQERLGLMNKYVGNIYTDALSALRYGASKEALLDEVEAAFDVHREYVTERGWLIGSDTEETK